MAQPSQQSFIHDTAVTWHTAAVLDWLSDRELRIAISQTDTYDHSLTTATVTGHCDFSLYQPNQSQTP